MKLLFFGLVGLLAVSIVALVQAEAKWQTWAQAHCHVIGEISGSTYPTVGVNPKGGTGFGVGFVPGKTGYRCDDGKEYWR